jgi:hypothetical protein
MPEKILDFDSSFIRGSNSSMEPGQLPLGSFWQGINLIDVSGVISCRPGYRCIVEVPAGNLQGLTIFRPRFGLPQAVVAVDGRIYVALYPFTNFRVLDNVSFSPSAKQIFWAQATQSARKITPGSLTSATEVLSPREVLFMQDGGFTAPAWFDGSQSGHIRDFPFQTPAGSSMKWIGDRLWVASKNQVFASDIADPFSFTEQIYLGGSTFFNFVSDVTAMVATPSLEFPQLVVFTDTNTSIIEASLRDRNAWPTTPGFQREILQVGCASNRGVASHFGRLIWYSPSGVTFYDPATSRGWTSRTPIRDNEMIVSKARLHSDLSLSAVGVYGQYFLLSLPVEDLYNKQTWVLNNASWETVSDEGGPTWNGYWLGTRPVEWAYGDVAGAERIYHVSADEDGVNRLWECFTPDRLDNECPITWAMWTRGYFGLTGQSQKTPGSPCRFGWAESKLLAIEEDLDFGIFYAPGTRGEFRQILGKKISVSRGSLSSSREITATSKLFAFKAQSRVPRSQDVNQNNELPESGSCPVESENNDDIDESFQLLLVGHGPATISWIRTIAYTEREDLTGDSKACEDEPPFNTLRFDGAGAYSEDLDTAVSELAAKPIVHYTSNQTASVSQDGFSAVGVGQAESIVSQQAADRVAKIIATKQAEAELKAMLSPIISLGEGFSDND